MDEFSIVVKGSSGNCPLTDVEVVMIKQSIEVMLNDMSVDDIHIEVSK